VCGLAGFCDFNKISTKEHLVEMTDQIKYRGPDGSGYFIDEKESYIIGLAHRRLSILDLSSNGSQPMTLDHLSIALNGEIYNFHEIKNELIIHGYSFISNSDTEVVLAAFHKWGVACVDRFIGMFVFVILDNLNEQLYLVRDRAGVKPLYYSFSNNTFIFGSELKSLVRHISFKKSVCPEAISNYFSLGYIPQPLTIYEDTFKLRSGHYLKFDLKTKKLEELQYWNLLDFYNKPKLSISEDELLLKIEELLISAFQYRMVSDVPVGIFLSGGYDSTAVAAILQSHQKSPINTYTIGFKEEKYNEAPFAKAIANYIGTNHKEHYCSIDDARSILPKLSTIFDEPFGDSSAIPTYLVSAIAKEDVTVALSADGGDEIFGGYNSYTITERYVNINKLNPLVKKLVYNAIKGLRVLIPSSFYRNEYNLETRIDKIHEMFNGNKSVEEIFGLVTSIFSPQQLEKLLVLETSKKFINKDSFRINLNSSSTLDNLMLIDFKTYMVDDILTKVDRTSMAVSLEGREPLLDHRIAELLAQVPVEMKVKNGDKKYLLKKIVHKYVPQELIDRPKKGFGFPVFEWLRDDLNEYIDVYITEHKIKQQGILNWREVNFILTEYRNGAKINAQKLWLILNFQMWYEKWMS
jgi:asparagine synthase (glutamine-hydrolysing)